jgi:hypothetical protein
MKMCSGSLVFKKVYSRTMDCSHVYLEPWNHYIPIKEDVSNLKEEWEWAEAHPEEFHHIARAVAAMCRKTGNQSFLDDALNRVIASLPLTMAEL